MMLRLDRFGQQALTDLAQERHDSTGAIMRTASLYYLADRDSGRPAWRVPRFLRDAPEAGSGLTVDLDDETWDALAAEARGQGVEPSRLAEHAFQYFLADLDAGRLADRLGGALWEDKKPPS
jgi:hypothetical protein